MRINHVTIKLIENALSFKLNPQQVDYLISDTPMCGGRGNGKTFAHCIKLALSDGEPLNVCYPEKYCDNDYGREDNRVTYARSYYRNMFQDVWERLKAAGFPVRQIVFERKEI